MTPLPRLDRGRVAVDPPAARRLRADPRPAPAGALRAAVAADRGRAPRPLGLARRAEPIAGWSGSRYPPAVLFAVGLALRARRAAALLDGDLAALGPEPILAQRLALLEIELRHETRLGWSATGERLAVPGDRALEPSRSGVRASKPNSSRARDASSLRRGWPFGIEVSQVISPLKPVSSAIELGELPDRDLLARAEVDRLGAVVALRGEQKPRRRSRRRRGTRASASRRPRARPRRRRLDHLADQGRDHVDVSRSKLSRGP